MKHAEASMVIWLALSALAIDDVAAFAFPSPSTRIQTESGRRRRYGALRTQRRRPLFSDPYDGDADTYDPNQWISGDDDDRAAFGDGASWEDALARREDGSLWSSFASSEEDVEGGGGSDSADTTSMDGGEEAWLDALANIAADEVEFMSKEADRADKARQMQELGFDTDAIASTLGVATDDALETDGDNEVLEAFKEESFGLMVDEDVDLATVESHSQVEWDEDRDEPVRAQHVYVDEVSCIGCTNCANIAQSTFFMEDEHGRARVFQQWGDDEETIQVAIETCPVDCIHYVSYDELKRLEVERRAQNINNKARLVSQAEYTSGAGYQASYGGGGGTFTGQQKISGNAGSRCNNCPSRGCENCPMFGVGRNPEFQRREEQRKMRRAKREMKRKMESQNKRAEL